MKSIRALERGLEVLRLLSQHEGRSLQQLHAASGLPKPTLLRILHTLEHSGWVWQAIYDGHWRRGVSLQVDERPSERAQRLAEIAAPHLMALQRKTLWPSDLLIYSDYMMELTESSRRLSGLAMNSRYRIGYRVELFLSAPGRAWLAWCTAAERAAVCAHYHAHPPVNSRSAQVFRHELEAILQDTRQRGFAVRDARFGGAEDEISAFDDGLDAIAVPILTAAGVRGCINLVWPRRYGLRAKVVEAHLEDLRATAQAIADGLHD